MGMRARWWPVRRWTMAADPHWTLQGGVALVTGAAGGIGAALALNLARRGMARTYQNQAVFKHETVIDNILTGKHST